MPAGFLRTQVRSAMDTIQKGITTLMRSAITGETLPLPEGFRLEDADELIRSQSLLPMVYQGAYNCGISPKTELMRGYQQQYFRILLKHQRQMRSVEAVCRAFEENGIDYALLKGCVMKPLYPNPEMRIMGDADILIRQEQYGRIRPVMEKLGFREDVESGYDVHWVGKDVLVELHRRLYSPGQADLHRYFENVWERVEAVSGNRHALSVEDTYLHIFTHMTKHFRHCGIGARQFVDLQVYRMAHPGMDEGKLSQALAELGLTDFHQNVLQLLRVWFEGAEADALTDAMTAYIFSSGSWGSIETKMYTEALIHATGNTKQAKGRSVLRTLFPELSYLQGSYNILYRHPWLYPVFIVVRWVDVLLHRRKNISKRLGILRDMSDERVTERKVFLDALGLDFYEQ